MHRAGSLTRGGYDALVLVADVYLYGNGRLNLATFICEGDVEERRVRQASARIGIGTVAEPFKTLVQLLLGHKPEIPVFRRVLFNLAHGHNGAGLKRGFLGVADCYNVLFVFKREHAAFGLDRHDAVN